MNNCLNDVVSDKKNIFLHAGTWRLNGPLSLTGAEDLFFQGESGTVISGATPLNTHWEPVGNGIYTAKTDLIADGLLVNGQTMQMARYPKFSGYAIPNSSDENRFAGSHTDHWKNPENAFFHTLHHAKWGSLHYRCTGRNPDGSLNWEGGWQVNRYSEPLKKCGYVENIYEELTEPGEWVIDYRTHTVFLIPPVGTDLSSAEVEIVSSESLISLKSCKNITFRNICFKNTARTFMKTNEPLLRSDWKIHRVGAVFAEDSEHIELSDCEFSHIGGNAVFFSGNCHACTVKTTHIHDCGASGIVFCGKPDSVRNPLFEYEERQSIKDISQIPGPAKKNYPEDCSAHDCLIHNTGTVEKQSAGIQIETASRITVSHCSIFHVPRAAVNIGSGCFGGHIIRDCDLFDTVLETGDHGSFNSWGRDRFWELKDFDPNAGKAYETALLDNVQTTLLEHNRVRCDHGWAVDLDDGSSNYMIRNNLLLAGGLKFREGFCRTAENNIILSNRLHLHVWFRYSNDVVKNNIFTAAYYPIRMPEKPWGNLFDCNFLCNFKTPLEHAEILSQLSGGDTHSLQGDPGFRNPEAGDYSLSPESPALSIGFIPFALNGFGVISPYLKAMADQPQMPDFTNTEHTTGQQTSKTFSFGTVRNISGLGDQSAFGLPSPEGVVLLKSVFFQENDVIVEIEGQSVRSINDLNDKSIQKGTSVKIIRNQHPLILKFQ